MTKKARQTRTLSQSVFTKSIGLISRLDPSRNLLLESRSWTSLLLSSYLISNYFQRYPMIFRKLRFPSNLSLSSNRQTLIGNNSLRMIKSENDFHLVWSSRIIFLSKVPLNNRFPERSRWLLSLSLSRSVGAGCPLSRSPACRRFLLSRLLRQPQLVLPPRGKQQQKNSLPYHSLFPHSVSHQVIFMGSWHSSSTKTLSAVPAFAPSTVGRPAAGNGSAGHTSTTIGRNQRQPSIGRTAKFLSWDRQWNHHGTNISSVFFRVNPKC